MAVSRFPPELECLVHLSICQHVSQSLRLWVRLVVSTLHTLVDCLSQHPASHSPGLHLPRPTSEINIENSRTDWLQHFQSAPGEVQSSPGCSINWLLSLSLSRFSCLNPAKLLNGFNLAELSY